MEVADRCGLPIVWVQANVYEEGRAAGWLRSRDFPSSGGAAALSIPTEIPMAAHPAGPNCLDRIHTPFNWLIALLHLVHVQIIKRTRSPIRPGGARGSLSRKRGSWGSGEIGIATNMLVGIQLTIMIHPDLRQLTAPPTQLRSAKRAWAFAITRQLPQALLEWVTPHTTITPRSAAQRDAAISKLGPP